jgi:hypothetical protein
LAQQNLVMGDEEDCEELDEGSGLTITALWVVLFGGIPPASSDVRHVTRKVKPNLKHMKPATAGDKAAGKDKAALKEWDKTVVPRISVWGGFCSTANKLVADEGCVGDADKCIHMDLVHELNTVSGGSSFQWTNFHVTAGGKLKLPRSSP